jgi:hypothetical protein
MQPSTGSTTSDPASSTSPITLCPGCARAEPKAPSPTGPTSVIPRRSTHATQKRAPACGTLPAARSGQHALLLGQDPVECLVDLSKLVNRASVRQLTQPTGSLTGSPPGTGHCQEGYPGPEYEEQRDADQRKHHTGHEQVQRHLAERHHDISVRA